MTTHVEIGEGVSFPRRPSTPWMIWISITSLAMWMAYRGFGRLGGDTVLDWLSVQAAVADLPYGLPVGVLAEHFGVDLPPWDGVVTSYSTWIHPRTPGALLLSSPLLLFDVQQAVDLGRAFAAIGWALVATTLICRVVPGRSHRIGLVMVAAMATPSVTMIIEYAPQIALIAVIVAVAWLGLRRGDAIWAGAGLGLAAVLRPSFGVLVVCLLLARRKRAAIAFLTVWGLVELTGGVVYGISFSDFVEMSREATALWIANPTNGAFLSQLHGFGIGAIPATILMVSFALVVLGLVWSNRRRAGVSLDGWIAVGVAMAVSLSPVAWNQYLILLVIPCAWALARLTGGSLRVAGAALVVSQVFSIWIWFNRQGNPLWGQGLALALLTAVFIILRGTLIGGSLDTVAVAPAQPVQVADRGRGTNMKWSDPNYESGG